MMVAALCFWNSSNILRIDACAVKSLIEAWSLTMGHEILLASLHSPGNRLNFGRRSAALGECPPRVARNLIDNTRARVVLLVPATARNSATRLCLNPRRRNMSVSVKINVLEEVLKTLANC